MTNATQAERFLARQDFEPFQGVDLLRSAAKLEGGPTLGYTEDSEECARFDDGSMLVSTERGWVAR